MKKPLIMLVLFAIGIFGISQDFSINTVYANSYVYDEVYTNWMYNESSSYAKGSTSNPYIISSEQGMFDLSDYVNGNNGKTINLFKDTNFRVENISEMTLKDFKPIGSNTTTKIFMGSFDGNDCVFNLDLNGNQNGYGLFGYVKGKSSSKSFIKNIITKGTFTRNSCSSTVYSGGVVGYAAYANIQNCTSYVNHVIEKLDYSVSSTPYIYYGGVIGYGTYTNVNSVRNYGKIDVSIASGAQTNIIGGVIAQLVNSSQIRYSYNMGEINFGSSNYSGFINLGGVAAIGSTTTTISCCFNSGNININKAKSINVGGVTVNSPSSSVDNCYNSGNIFAYNITDRATIGGVSSLMSNTLSCCYSFGYIKTNRTEETTEIGAISGRTTDNVINCYYDTRVVENLGGLGGSDTETCYGFDMYQSTEEDFKNFNFYSTWIIVPEDTYGYYPQLRSLRQSSNEQTVNDSIESVSLNFFAILESSSLEETYNDSIALNIITNMVDAEIYWYLNDTLVENSDKYLYINDADQSGTYHCTLSIEDFTIRTNDIEVILNKAEGIYAPDFIDIDSVTLTYGTLLDQVELPQGWSLNSNDLLTYREEPYMRDCTFISENPNYKPVTKEIAVIVEKAYYDINVTFDDLTVTYDGEQHSIVIIGELPEGVSVTYTNNVLTEVGTLTATATFTSDETNYHPIDDLTATLTITSAETEDECHLIKYRRCHRYNVFVIVIKTDESGNKTCKVYTLEEYKEQYGDELPSCEYNCHVHRKHSRNRNHCHSWRFNGSNHNRNVCWHRKHC